MLIRRRKVRIEIEHTRIVVSGGVVSQEAAGTIVPGEMAVEAAMAAKPATPALGAAASEGENPQ